MDGWIGFILLSVLNILQRRINARCMTLFHEAFLMFLGKFDTKQGGENRYVVSFATCNHRILLQVELVLVHGYLVDFGNRRKLAIGLQKNSRTLIVNTRIWCLGHLGVNVTDSKQ